MMSSPELQDTPAPSLRERLAPKSLSEQFHSLWRSTPLRLALAIAFMFLVVAALSFLATWFVVLRGAEQGLKDSLNQEMMVYEALPNEAALIAQIQREAEQLGSGERLLGFRTGGGQAYGNLSVPTDRSGFFFRDLDEESLLPGSVKHEPRMKGDYLLSVRAMHGGQFALARDAEARDDARENLFAVFLFTMLPTALLTIASGLFIANRSQQRMRQIESTLDQFTAGNLAARVKGDAWQQQDLREMAVCIDRMADSQQQQITALRQVSADIAHDLKTPIQRVSVMLSELESQPELGAESRQLIERAGEETDGIVRTFHALLQLAQIEGGASAAQHTLVDLATLCQNLHELYEPEAAAQGRLLALHCELERGSGDVLGNKSLLQQLLVNLIENALRHTPHGSRIDITLKDGAVGELQLLVADTGPGIEAHERENALKRLYRLERSRSTPGNGLGLSLAAAIAEHHKGRLQLEDNNPGLRVVVTLPLAS